MGNLKIAAVVVVLAAFAGNANAQGTIAWAGGFPDRKDGNTTVANAFFTQGTVAPADGWSITSKVKIKAWRTGEDGGVEVKPFSAYDLTDNAWGPIATLPNFVGGEHYWVYAEVEMTEKADSNNKKRLRTAIVKVEAAKKTK